MRIPYRALSAVAAGALALAAGAGFVNDPASADHEGNLIDEEVSCLEPVPAHASLSTSPTKTVKVRVVLDGTTTSQRDSVIAAANATFAARGIQMTVSGTEVWDLSGTDARDLINQAKGGYPNSEVPSGSHIVLILSSVDLTGPAGSATAGLADCVGGARFREHGFAVAEVRSSVAPIIVAHEVGHLLGAQHHYANCVERGGSSVALHVGFPPCTVMINDVGLARPEMSQVTGVVVRGHAEQL